MIVDATSELRKALYSLLVHRVFYTTPFVNNKTITVNNANITRRPCLLIIFSRLDPKPRLDKNVLRTSAHDAVSSAQQFMYNYYNNIFATVGLSLNSVTLHPLSSKRRQGFFRCLSVFSVGDITSSYMRYRTRTN